MTKNCIVTGGSSGIGASIIECFIKQGYHVFNFDIQPNNEGTFIQCDMADMQQVRSAVSQVSSLSPTIDCVISNAGIHLSATIENTSDADFEHLFAINVKGAYALTQAVLPIMKKQKQGNFVYVASDQALIGKQNSFAYNLSKHALASITKTTALDYAQFGIRANAVCPGTIETSLYHNAIDAYCQRSGADKVQVHRDEEALQPLGRLGQPKEVAELIYFLASDKAKFITGSLHSIDGGFTCQ